MRGRRTLLIAAAATLVVALLPARASADPVGTFTVTGGSTLYDIDNPATVEVTGTTTTLDNTADVVVYLDGSPVASTKENEALFGGGEFTAHFTYPRPTCATTGSHEQRTLGVRIGGQPLPDQVLTYRCTDYAVTVIPHTERSTYVAGADWVAGDQAAGTDTRPDMLLCVDSVENGATFARVPLTSGALQYLNARELTNLVDANGAGGPASNQSLALSIPSFDGAGCALIDHGGTAADQSGTISITGTLTNPHNPANNPSNTYTATIERSDLVSAQPCVDPASDGSVTLPVTGTRWADAFGSYRLRVTVTAASGSGSRDVTAPLTIDNEGYFSAAVPLGQVASGESAVVTVQRQDDFGAWADVPRSQRGSSQLTCSNGQTKNPRITPSPRRFATTTGTRTVKVTGAGFTPAVPLTAQLDGTPVATTDASGQPAAAVPDAQGGVTTYIRPQNLSCLVPHLLTLSTAGSTGGVPTGQQAAYPLEVTCPAQSSFTYDRSLPTNDDVFGTSVTSFLYDYDPHVTTSATLNGVTPATPVQETDGDGHAYTSVDGAGLVCGTTVPLVVAEPADPAAYSVPPTSTALLHERCSADPKLGTTPDSVAYTPGTRRLPVYATGLRPGSQQALTMDGAGANPATVTAGRDGRANVDVALPGTRCGQHSLGLSPTDTSGDHGATGIVTVTCPVVTADRTTIDAESLPQAVTITSTGFDANGSVTLSFPDGTTKTADLQDGQLGTLRYAGEGTRLDPGITWNVDGGACGPQPVTVTENDAPATVQPSAVTVVNLVCPKPPTLAVSPAAYAQTDGTRTVHLLGSGWRAGTTLPLTFDGHPLQSVLVSASGAFDTTVSIAGAAPGLHSLTGVQGAYRSAAAVVVVTAPVASVTPASYARDNPPSSVTVSGTGFDPQFPLVLHLPGVPDQSLTVDPTGAVSTSVPTRDIGCGSDPVVLAEPVFPGAPFTASPQATATLTVDCPGNPKVTVAPASFAYTSAGHTLPVSGTGFRPATQVTVSGEGFTTVSTTTDATGSFRVPITTRAPCGTYGVTAAPAVGYSAATSFTVTCPVLASTPSALNGLHLPSRVTVTGSGYDPLTSVDLVLQQSGAPVSVRITTSPTGTFTTSLPAKDLFCGTAPIVGTERVGASPPPAASTVDLVTCAAPVVEVSPRVASLGSAASIKGHNFHPGSTVALSWLLGDGSPGLGECEATVKADTTFAASCLVFPHDALGVRQIVAVDDRGSGATTHLLVVANPVEPGRENDVTLRRLLSRR